MNETDQLQPHEDFFAEAPSYIPAQFRPSSQLAWRTHLAITSTLYADRQAANSSSDFGTRPRREPQPA